jgi:hypothetical protein
MSRKSGDTDLGINDNGEVVGYFLLRKLSPCSCLHSRVGPQLVPNW